MIIKDIHGLYEIKVDTERGIVFQTHFKGIFKTEVLLRMDKDYKTQVIPLLKGRKWAKFCDLRNYTLGNIAEEMNSHNKFCIENGMSCAALIVESAIVKMQMNRAGKEVALAPMAFTDFAEADQWLKEQGY